MLMNRLFSTIGRSLIIFASGYGRLTILLAQTVYAFRRIHRYIPQIVEQYTYIGRKSVPLVTIGSIFMGLLLGVQIGTQMDPRTPVWVEGGLILRTVLLEMGPIVIGLVLAGRVGSGIASELGTMKVTEQVDALRTMGVDPVEYLVMPRLLAGMVAVPTLIIYADFLAIISGFASSYFAIDMSWPEFVRGMRSVFIRTDVYTSIIKAFIFSVIIVIYGSFFGLESRRGAKGVGESTTYAVVWSSIAIIAVDYVISAVLYFVW